MNFFLFIGFSDGKNHKQNGRFILASKDSMTHFNPVLLADVILNTKI